MVNGKWGGGGDVPSPQSSPRMGEEVRGNGGGLSAVAGGGAGGVEGVAGYVVEEEGQILVGGEVAEVGFQQLEFSHLQVQQVVDDGGAGGVRQGEAAVAVGEEGSHRAQPQHGVCVGEVGVVLAGD